MKLESNVFLVFLYKKGVWTNTPLVLARAKHPLSIPSFPFFSPLFALSHSLSTFPFPIHLQHMNFLLFEKSTTREFMSLSLILLHLRLTFIPVCIYLQSTSSHPPTCFTYLHPARLLVLGIDPWESN